MTDAKPRHPEQRHLDKAHVLKLAASMGLEDYDSLLKFSIEHPDIYWQGAIDYLGIRWDTPPEGYVDLSRGKEFPQWFPGGRLNWVNTVLAFGDDFGTASQLALVAEDEDGRVNTATFAELKEKVRRFASGLRSVGISRGDRVGLLCDNGVEATVSVLALSAIGAIVVPLFSGFGQEAVISRLKPSGARAIIATTGFSRRGNYVDMQPVVRSVAQALPSLETIIWKCAPGVDTPANGVNWNDLVATKDDGKPVEIMGSMDPFMVIFTSGTTGKPKGPVHTHGGCPLRMAHDSAVHFNVSSGDTFCWPADMGWIAGMLVPASALMRGATLVLYNGAPDYPDWSRMSKLIEDHKITHYGSSPTLIRGLAANESLALKHDLSSVELLITAGEVIDREHFVWFQDHFAPRHPADQLYRRHRGFGRTACQRTGQADRAGRVQHRGPGHRRGRDRRCRHPCRGRDWRIGDPGALSRHDRLVLAGRCALPRLLLVDHPRRLGAWRPRPEEPRWLLPDDGPLG
ncbi:MAG: AMP-binding protein [Roseovarius sp.]|nr:AMP-binding protein [Roseovarius sp.]